MQQWLERYGWGRSLLDELRPRNLLTTDNAAPTLSASFGLLGDLVVILLIGLYLAVDPGIYARGLRVLVAPSLRPRAAEVLDDVGDTLQGWLVAQLLSMSVIGVLTLLGLWLLGIPLAPVLALIAALLTFIPNIGPVLAAVPAILLGLADGPMAALWVALLYTAIQTAESYFITPLIQQRAIALPPALILSAQLLMGTLFGILGLALATPLAAAGLTLTRKLYVDGYLEREPSLPRAPSHDAGCPIAKAVPQA